MTLNKQSIDNNVELLNYVYKNAKMGSQSISQLLPKVNDRYLQETLLNQLSQYQGVVNKASEMMTSFNVSPKECVIDKIGSKAGIAFNTLTDTSTSHIAEMMITGSTMGVIDLTRKFNESTGCQQSICDLCNDLVKIEEQGAQNLKQFL